MGDVEAVGETDTAGAAVSGGLPSEVTTSTPVATATTATSVTATSTNLRLARLCLTCRAASSRRSSARLRLTFLCDMNAPESSSGVTIGGTL